MSLIDDIAAAFPAAPIPARDDLKGACECLECEELVEVFAGRAWPDLTLAEIARHEAKLFLFAPAAFAYYLPAFMRASLRGLRAATSDVRDSTAYILTPPEDDDDIAYHQERVSRLTAEQRAVVDEFLRFVEEQEDPAAQIPRMSREPPN